MTIRTTKQSLKITKRQARHIWIATQRLNEDAPFGEGPDAVASAVQQLGYVQIDTINVIERCHHHMLFNRIPTYQRADLHAAQSEHKTVFEYWTHALSFIPTQDFKYFLPEMKAHKSDPTGWRGVTNTEDLQRVMGRIQREGPLAITDFKDDKLVEKKHLWASKKPSKSALQAGFFSGQLVIAKRQGMLKSYELTKRHFGWQHLPKPASEKQKLNYLLNRALNAQGIISLHSVAHLKANRKAKIADLIIARVRKKQLIAVEIENGDHGQYWVSPTLLDNIKSPPEDLVHILSPFDPLVIQRKRTEFLFDYAHLFEAYVPEPKRKWGYFSLPVLVGDKIVAALDLKTDRQNNRLLIQNWIWMADADQKALTRLIEPALEKFEAFQLART